MEENNKTILAVEAEVDVGTELYSQEVTMTETVGEINVESVPEMTIDVTETTGVVVGTNVVSEHTHELEEITNLLNKLNQLGSAKNTVYSRYGGVAEFRQWEDNNRSSEYRVGYFVGLVSKDKKDPISGGNVFIEICNGDTDVYGVTVDDSAVCGYQNRDYCLLDITTDNIVDNSKPITDNNDDSSYDKVCLLGVVSVRQGSSYHNSGRNAQVGDYVIPDDNGCAIYSENGVGFRVVSVGQLTGAMDDRWNYKYVDIALVPQNDNVARVMAELEGTKQNIGNLSIQIGKLEDNINNSITSVIPGINETLENLNGVVSDTQNKLDSASDALDAAQTISGEAKDAINLANDNYAKAVSDMEAAKTSANNALASVSKIEQDMTVLKQHEDKIVSFFDEANEDEASLAIMVKQTGDIALIKAKTDKNGAALEHLVAHADRYCVGEHSLSYGLSYEEALGILGKTGKEERNGYIYVSTVKHDEKETVYSWGNEFVTFEEGKAYVWMYDADGPNDTCHRWKESSINVSLGNEPTTKVDGDLWYTWNGVRVDNVWQYEPETLYRWTAYDDGDGDWIAVARANDGNARTMSFINQTAKEISSTVTNLGGDVSEVKQEVGNISSTVSTVQGDLTRINQTAEAITLGTYSPDQGVSSLEILLNGMRNTTSFDEHILVGEFSGSIVPGIKMYTVKPTWTEKEGFKFDDKYETTEPSYPMYYLDYTVDEDGNRIDKTTYYCEQIDDDTYKIYAIGNQALAGIKTYVDENKATIESLTEFKSEVSDEFGNIRTDLTAVQEQSDENKAQILSIAQMQNVFCSDIKSVLTDEEIEVFANAEKYNSPPVWDANEDKFKFTGETSEKGVYCILNDTKKYYKIIDTANGKGYEQYELSSVKFASIEQKVDDNGASIGLIVENIGNEKGEVNGASIVASINESGSQIEMDAVNIDLTGYVTFNSLTERGKTSINGDNIKTGVITSNNYSGPVTHRMYGTKIVANNLVCSFTSGIKEYDILITDDIAYKGIMGGFEYYIGMNLDIEAGIYYYNYDNEWMPINIQAREVKAGSMTYTEYYYNALQSNIPTNQLINVYLHATTFERFITTGDTPTSYICYTPIVNGEIYPADGEYYYCNEISLGSEVHVVEITDGEVSANGYQYIVSDKDFDLQRRNIETEGTKFDLNVGTIYSKNFSIDRDGDLTIAGRITATSGYIGNANNGFFISCVGLIHTVGDDETTLEILEGSEEKVLPVGKYYFKYENKYYLFSIDQTMYINDKIIVSFEEKKMYATNGVTSDIEITETEPNEAILLSSIYTSNYSLSNNQWSYDGNGSGNDGVYIGPDGIGLGNGNFYVDKSGDLVTNGGITLNSISTDNSTISQITLENGAMSLISETTIDEETKKSQILLSNGDIKLTGSIAWDLAESLICVLYANEGIEDENGQPRKPNSDIYEDAESDSIGWHTEYHSGDLYVSYSYDGGKEWTEPIRMRGEDGTNEEPVDVEGILEEVYGITYTEITGTSIESPSISSPTINAGTITSIAVNSSTINGGTINGSLIDGARFNGGNFYGGNYYTKGLMSNTGSGYYLYNSISFDDKDKIFGMGTQVGYLGYDIDHATTGTPSRVFLGTSNGTALKLVSAAGISLEAATNNKIYLMSDVVFSGAVEGLQVTFG